jgi:3-isopropylmalate dehydrogenase
VAVIPGDGIGPEVVQATLQVLQALENRFSLSFDLEHVEAGDDAKTKFGVALPEKSYEAVSSSNACLKGPVGESAKQVIIALRQRLNLYANIRPAITLPNVPSIHSDVDLVVVRENTEGLYKGIEDKTPGYAFSVRVVTREASLRIARVAYDMAMKRRRTVTVVHKSNVLSSCELFSECCLDVAKRYPEVQTEQMYVDNASYQLVRNPRRFDVIVTTNLFGDILSDEAAGVVGSLGLSPSMNLGDQFGLFEPVHGSAPDLPKGTANPLATMMSAKLMLEWLAEKHKDYTMKQASETLWNGILQILRKRMFTPDLGGSSTTAQVTEAIIHEISTQSPS